MRTMICLVVGLLSFMPSGVRAEPTELECLTEAVLAESTLARGEPIEADQAVAYTIYLRSQDPRFGPGVCKTVHTRYAHTAYRMVKKWIKKGKKRLVRQAY